VRKRDTYEILAKRKNLEILKGGPRGSLEGLNTRMGDSLRFCLETGERKKSFTPKETGTGKRRLGGAKAKKIAELADPKG